MKRLEETLIKIFMALCFLMVIGTASSWSTYGQPNAFGNETHDTCWIGGDSGQINCTGDLNISKIFIIGPSAQIRFNDTDTNVAWHMNPWSLVGGFSFAETGVRDWFVIQNTTGNIGIDQNRPSYKLQILNVFNVSAQGNAHLNGSLNLFSLNATNITSYEYRNMSGTLAWINPENVNDIDKENIERDLNTFVDIDGDYMEANLEMDDGVGESPKITWINQNDQEGNIFLQTSGDLRLDSANDLELIPAGKISLLKNTEVTGYVNATLFEGDGSNLWGVWNTTADIILVANNSINLFTDKILPSGLFSFINALSPGFLNITALNVTGSEYHGDNDKIFLGDNQDAEIYFDGTKLILKV